MPRVGKPFVTGSSHVREIVGVVHDVRPNVLGDVQPMFCQPLVRRGGLLPKPLRTSGGGVADAVEQLATRLDPRLRVRTNRLSDSLKTQLESTIWGPLLAGVLGAFALLLATVGMFGVFAYAVRQRTREIGIRMALGARGSAVIRVLVAAHSRRAVGLLFGLVGSIAASIVLRNQLHGLSPFGPIAYLEVAGILTVAGLAACYVPARRATRIDPMEALRCD